MASKLQNKEARSKAPQEECQLTYKGRHVHKIPDLSPAILKSREARNDIFQELKINNCQSRLLMPAKLSLKVGRIIRTFQDKPHQGSPAS